MDVIEHMEKQECSRGSNRVATAKKTKLEKGRNLLKYMVPLRRIELAT
jgi:hypothetical protein